MKAIVVLSDSMRRDHVGTYGSPPWLTIHTPNLDRFAEQATVFENAYIGSFPTVPMRRDMMLGKGDKGLPLNRWKGLEKDEPTLPHFLGNKGIPTMLIADTANNVVSGINLQRDYDAWVCNRGQEGDSYWMDDSVPLTYTCPPELVRYDEANWRRILVNRSRRTKETDWFAPGTYSMAMDWLGANYSRKDFFLWIDTFDPHEPWDPPQAYIDRYDKGYSGRVFDAPTYGIRKYMDYTDRELAHTRARYAGEVTMVDTWFGHLMNRLESLGIAEETAIFYLSDHGTCFDGPGDCGMIQKMSWFDADWTWMAGGRAPKLPVRYIALPETVARIPLIVKLPGVKGGKRVDSIVQPWDLTATILDLFGAEKSPDMIGNSLLGLIDPSAAKKDAHTDGPRRKAAIVGRSGSEWDPAKGFIQAMDGQWVYALFEDRSPMLHDLSKDPECAVNLWGEPSARAHQERLREEILRFIMKQNLDKDFMRRYQGA